MDGAAPRPLAALGDDWYEWTDDLPEGVELRVRAVELADGRHHLDGIQVDGPVTAALLRSIPIGRIEAAVNALLHPTGDGGRWRAEARIPDHLREAAPGYPDEFYETVARAYRSLAALSPRPVAELAQANDVPATTVQRWVKEARARGMLPPGRRGKSG